MGASEQSDFKPLPWYALSKSAHDGSTKPHPTSCAYPNCIIAQNYQLQKVISIKKRQNRLDDKAQFELKKRLEASYGQNKESVTRPLTI